MKLRIRGVLLLAVGCLLIAACGAEGASLEDLTADVEPTKPSKDAGFKRDASADAAERDVEQVDAAPPSPPPVSGDQLCAQQADCGGCCATNHYAGYTAYIGAYVGCLCVPTVCKSECAASLCSSTPQSPDFACDTCLGNKGDAACMSAAEGACIANNDCMQMMNCVNACPF